MSPYFLFRITAELTEPLWSLADEAVVDDLSWFPAALLVPAVSLELFFLSSSLWLMSMSR